MADKTRHGRRERRRDETTAEIKRVAMDLMANDGPSAITLRAIAREMEMSTNAIYSYFATRDELITALIRDVYGSLANALDTVLQQPGDELSTRIRRWAQAFRAWALDNPNGFRLVYGEAVPGYQPPPGGAAPAAEMRFCMGITSLAAQAWPYAEQFYANSDFQWSDFGTDFMAAVHAEFPDLPPTAMAVTLRIWSHLHGLLSLELHARLHVSATTVDKIFDQELNQLLRSLGLQDEKADTIDLSTRRDCPGSG